MSQQSWLQIQYALDDGAAVCPACDAVGPGAYCRQCGAAFQAGPALHACPTCHLAGPGPYCSHCGAALETHATADLDALEAGTFDWAAWEAELQPVLQRLQAQGTNGRAGDG